MAMAGAGDSRSGHCRIPGAPRATGVKGHPMKRCLITLIFLLCHADAWGGSLLTKSEDFSKAATYGMNMATYSMEMMDARQAAEKLATFDVVWDIMGKGEEVLLNGDPDAFPKLKDDVLKIKLVLDKVAEVSAKLGEGVYDEALMGSVDVMVGMVNHPMVNGLWEAVKLAYQSHRLVQDSRAALEIETLYGIVNYDRRLRGTAGSDGPKLFSVDADTVTYFFNKYLITDESTRGLVKTYVKNKLGEEFPELPASDSALAWLRGTLDEEKNEHEVRLLQEFENSSRRWTMQLLKDLNEQVKKEWVATRLHQEQEKFKAFTDQVGKAFANVDQVFAYYANQAALRKQAAGFPATLKELAEKRTRLEAQYAPLRPSQFNERMAARNGLHQVMSEASRHAVFCLIINDFTLQKEFEALHLAVMQRIDAIDREMSVQRETATEEALTLAEGAGDDYRAYEASLDKRFKPVVDDAISFLDDYRPLEPSEISSLLAENNMEEAELRIVAWQVEQGKLFEKVQATFNKDFAAITQGDSPPVTETPMYQRYLRRGDQNPGIREMVLHDATRERDTYWRNAAAKAEDAFTIAFGTASLAYSRDHQELSQVFEYFATETKRIRTAVTENIAAIRAIKGQIADHVLALSPGASYRNRILDNFSLADFEPGATIDEAEAYLRDNRHATIGKIDDADVAINTVAWQIRKRRDRIAAPIDLLNGHISGINAFAVLAERIRNAQKRADGFKPLDDQTVALYNDLAAYPSEQAAEDASFAGRTDPKANPPRSLTYTTTEKNWDGESWTTREVENIKFPSVVNPAWGKIDYRRHLDSIKGLQGMNPAAMEARGRKLIAEIEQDLANRQRDIDHLTELEQEFTAWYEKQLRDSVIVQDSQSGHYVPRGDLYPDRVTGHAIVNTPYPHFALADELAREPKLAKAEENLKRLKVHRFIQDSMPATKAMLATLFTSKGFYLPAKEDNFLIGNTPVWKSDLATARRILEPLKPDSGDYRKQLELVEKLLPFTIEFPPLPTDRKARRSEEIQHTIGRFKENAGLQHFDFELGKEFAALRIMVQELIIGKGRLIEQESLAETQVASGRERLAEFRKTFDAIAADTERYLAQKTVEQADYDGISSRYWDLRSRYDGDTFAQDSTFTGQLAAHEGKLASLQGMTIDPRQRDTERIEAFYGTFKAAYESKNDSGLMGCLDDDWSAGDGTTLADLQDHFRNMFSVFDQIQLTMSGLRIERKGTDGYLVSYDLLIVGSIYAENIRHEEKSSVAEEVSMDSAGQVRISRTSRGRFWYVQ